MLEERHVGSLELLERLAEDPFGSVHRGLEWTETRRTREVLVRTYHPAWLDRGLSSRQHEVLRELLHLGHLKPYKGCHASRDGSGRLVWPFAPGRSLAQVLRSAEEQGLPFGIDQALFLVWALSHHIRHLHQVKLSPGVLTPHRVWIGFDGWVQLLDVPVIGILQELLPSAPDVRKEFASYLQGPAGNGLDREAFQLGALLFEMLTHRPLPCGTDFAAVIAEAKVGMPDGHREPVPESIACLLKRLLGRSDPFQTLEELERTMEDSLFGGDFDPSTFGLAFTMQTLFRHDISASAMSLAGSAADTASEAPDPGPPAAPRPAGSPRRRLGLAAAGCALAGSLLWIGARATIHPTIPARASDMRPVTAAPEAPPLPALPEPVKPAPLPAPAPLPVKVAPDPVSSPRPGQPVKLRVFVDEQGRVRQVHVISGALEGSERERAACAAAMTKSFPAVPPGGTGTRTWEEITVVVP